MFNLYLDDPYQFCGLVYWCITADYWRIMAGMRPPGGMGMGGFPPSYYGQHPGRFV